MRAIITGGTGLIGRSLALGLARDGHEVIVLSRSPERYPRVPSGVRVERWDARSADGWGGLADGADVIVNLAGASLAAGRWTEERKRAIRASRVNAGRAVTEAVRAAAVKPRVVIQASAVGYYGPHGPEPIPESTPPGTDFLADVCNEWEASSAEVETLGVRRAIIRTGVVLSREEGALPRLLLPVKFCVGGPLGNGRQGFPWLHLADEVAAIRFLLERDDASGPFNLTAPNPPTNREFVQALGRAIGRPTVLPAPAFALKLMLGEMATVVLDGQRAVPARLQASGYSFRFTDPEAALRDLLK